MRWVAAGLFRWRGVLAGALGVSVGLWARPDAASVAVGVVPIGLGLGLRAWAFSHLGSVGRTRDPQPPATRVVTGPYRLVAHPVYLGNVCIAGGIVAVASLPWALSLGALLPAVGLWGSLALGEGRGLAASRPRPSAGLRLAQIARSERSTWASVGALLMLQGLVGALRGA